MRTAQSRGAAQQLLGAGGLVAAGIVAGNASGLLREAVVAALFGTTSTADVFLIAFTVPEFLFTLLTTTIGAALIPMLMKQVAAARKPGGKADWAPEARQLLANSGYLALMLLPVAAASIVAAPLYIRWLAPGFNPAEVLLATEMSRVMLVAVVVWGVSAALGSTLNALRHFGLPALTTAAYNLTFAAVALLWHEQLGPEALAWGVLIGAGAMVMIQIPQLLSLVGSARRAVGHQIGLAGFREWAKSFGQVAGWLALGYTLHHASIFVDRAMASGLSAGSVAALNYAYRLPLMIGQVLGMAVSTAMFPEVAARAASGSMRALRDIVGQGIRGLLLAGAPAIVALVVLREPAIRLAFQRGSFGEQATSLIAHLLVLCVVGVFADMLCQPLWRAIYALQDSKAVVWVNGLKTALRLGLNLALVPLLSADGIAISFSIGLSVQLAILLVVVSRRVGPLVDGALVSFAARVLLASAAMGLLTYTVQERLAALMPLTVAGVIVAAAAAGIAGLLAFVVASYVLRVAEMELAVRYVVGRISHRSLVAS